MVKDSNPSKDKQNKAKRPNEQRRNKGEGITHIFRVISKDGTVLDIESHLLVTSAIIAITVVDPVAIIETLVGYIFDLQNNYQF